jgi:hypothetical protein
MQDLPFELPRIDVGLLWHRRHEPDTAQRWLRAALRGAATQVAAQVAQVNQDMTHADTAGTADDRDDRDDRRIAAVH